MGLKLSTNTQPRMRSYSGSSPSGSNSTTGDLAVGRGGARARTRSLGSFQTAGHSGALGIPPSNGAVHMSNSPDSDSSSPEDGGPFGRAFAHSLPVHLFALQGIKCPVCSKFIPPDDIECHLVLCLTKPRITYNEDVLADDKGECVICFEDLEKGDIIARLPCLCIYHKGCIDSWFEVNRSCPEHPSE